MLRGVGSVCPATVKNLVIYNLAFGVVTYCDTLRLHVDNHHQLGCKVWTIIIPIQLVDGSPPELEVQEQEVNAEDIQKRPWAMVW